MRGSRSGKRWLVKEEVGFLLTVGREKREAVSPPLHSPFSTQWPSPLPGIQPLRTVVFGEVRKRGI